MKIISIARVTIQGWWDEVATTRRKHFQKPPNLKQSELGLLLKLMATIVQQAVVAERTRCAEVVSAAREAARIAQVELESTFVEMLELIQKPGDDVTENEERMRANEAKRAEGEATSPESALVLAR